MRAEGIILAAGLSSRTVCHKMVLPLGGRTVIENCIEGMYDTCSNIIVVEGYKPENMAPILHNYSKVQLAINHDYMNGMFSSVKEGLRHITAERFFLTPGDCPVIPASIYKRMLMVDGDIVIPAYKGEKGHPVLLSSFLIGGILEYIGESLGKYIESKGYTVLDVNEPGILMDIDTMEDYEKLRNYYEMRFK